MQARWRSGSCVPWESYLRWHTDSMPYLELVTIVVDDYDLAIKFFVAVLGFELADDLPFAHR